MSRIIINEAMLARDIAQFSADCIHLKKALRTTWTRPMAEEQRRLVRVRRSLTELHVLLAWSRGRLHVRTAPREVRDAAGESFDPSTWDAVGYHQTVVDRVMKPYTPTPPMPAQVST